MLVVHDRGDVYRFEIGKRFVRNWTDDVSSDDGKFSDLKTTNKFIDGASTIKNIVDFKSRPMTARSLLKNRLS